MAEAGRPVVALVGNPNVGKSTLFNAATGLRQHTGNWAGVTVSAARGTARRGGREFTLIDLPGTYALSARSPEEEVTRAFLAGGGADVTAVVCDAACLERGLILFYQVRELTGRAVVCVSMLDEAARRGISVDLKELSRALGAPVMGGGLGAEGLLDAAAEAALGPPLPLLPPAGAAEQAAAAERAARRAVRTRGDPGAPDRRLDRVLTGRYTALPCLALLLLGVLWLTAVGANVPSQWLSALFARGEAALSALLAALSAPEWLRGALAEGAFRVLGWVVSVMLPPMAIFFPLFALLEELGYLPRVAFVADRAFQGCRACGKQALTMCMGLGCNAVGVTGCRIIDSPRERLLAVLTNSLMPCNGRFPAMIAVFTLCFAGRGGALAAAAAVAGVIALGAGLTFLLCRLLSATVLRGVPSAFTLELPPYRRPRVGQVVVRSVLDRTLHVLARAAAVAAPAGLLLWALAHVEAGGVTLLSALAGALDPLGRLLGMDGALLAAFLLGWPANEIVLPIALMIYLSGGSLTEWDSLAGLGQVLADNGWTWLTAVCMAVFSLAHWPCATTCLTIYRETGRLRWTLLAMALPTAAGGLLCAGIAAAARLAGLA